MLGVGKQHREQVADYRSYGDWPAMPRPLVARVNDEIEDDGFITVWPAIAPITADHIGIIVVDPADFTPFHDGASNR